MISKDFQDEVWQKLNSIERRLIYVSSGGPPVNAEYVVMSLNAILTNERRLQASEGIALADGGAGGDADLTLDINGLVEDAAGAAGDFFVYYDVVAGDHKKIDWGDMPGGGGDVTAAANLADDYVTRGDGGVKGIQDSLLYLTDAGFLALNETANAKMTIGLTINQGTSDNEIFAFKSSDVNHGITSRAETDTYAKGQKTEGAYGGLNIEAYQESGGSAQAALNLGGFTKNSKTGMSATQAAVINLQGIYCGGGTNRRPAPANFVIAGISTYDSGSNWRYKWQVDQEGDTWQLGGITADGIPSGATQAASGAGAGEFWETASHATLPDHVLMYGV